MSINNYNALEKLNETRAHGVDQHYTESINDDVVLDVKFQSGGTATHEKNGVFIEDLLIVAIAKLEEFNKQFPCRENSIAITNIEQAIQWLHSRKVERTARGVYGKDEK